MNKRRLIAVLIAYVLMIFATAMWSASTDEREGDPDAIVLEDSASEAGPVDEAEVACGRGDRDGAAGGEGEIAVLEGLQGFEGGAVRGEAEVHARSCS